MVILIINNKRTRVRGAPSKVMRKLSKVTSYRVAGFMFASSFKAKRWDGKEHLTTYSRKNGYTFPTGLLTDVCKKLLKLKVPFEIEDERVLPEKYIKFSWNSDIKLRNYQKRAIKAVTKDGVFKGRGLLDMPIRSGKSYTAAGIIHQLGVRALVVVPSKALLHQMKDDLELTLQREVGLIGDGFWQEKEVTVATIQTLIGARPVQENKKKKTKAKNWTKEGKKKWARLIRRYDLVIFDEAHHLTADAWRNVMVDFHAPYKIGVSATIYLDNDRETEKGVIWLAACCGHVRYEITVSYLIRKGYLKRPRIELYPILKPSMDGYGWSQELVREAILVNPERNEQAVKLAIKYMRRKMPVLMVSNRLEQVSAVAELLDEYNVPFATITGRDETQEREEKKQLYLEGHYKVLLGTVLGEGVNIPEIACVIILEGGRDIKRTMQRLRNLTPHDTKKEAVVCDFMDMMNGYLAEHSLERLRVYRSEPEFIVELKAA